MGVNVPMPFQSLRRVGIAHHSSVRIQAIPPRPMMGERVGVRGSQGNGQRASMLAAVPSELLIPAPAISPLKPHPFYPRPFWGEGWGEGVR